MYGTAERETCKTSLIMVIKSNEPCVAFPFCRHTSWSSVVVSPETCDGRCLNPGWQKSVFSLRSLRLFKSKSYRFGPCGLCFKSDSSYISDCTLDYSAAWRLRSQKEDVLFWSASWPDKSKEAPAYSCVPINSTPEGISLTPLLCQ